MVDEVWQQAFIPKRLDEVDTFERDQRRLRSGGGETEGVYYQSITGMKKDLSGVETTPKILRAKQDAEGLGWAGMATTTSASARRREDNKNNKNNKEASGSSGDADADGSDSDSDASDSGSSSESEEELDENGDPIRRRRRKEPVDKAALKAARKANKTQVKAEAAEKRKTKIPKHVKKKATRGNKKK